MKGLTCIDIRDASWYLQCQSEFEPRENNKFPFYTRFHYQTEVWTNENGDIILINKAMSVLRFIL